MLLDWEIDVQSDLTSAACNDTTARQGDWRTEKYTWESAEMVLRVCSLR